MKKTYLLLSLPLAFGAMSVCGGVAHADEIFVFNFNDAVTADPTQVLDVDRASANNSGLTLSSTATVLAGGNTGTTVGARMGDIAGRDLTLTQTGTAGVTQTLTLNNVNTTGFNSTYFSLATQRSSTGFTTQTYSYRIGDTGAFIDFPTNSTFSPPAAFGLFTQDISSFAANQNNIDFMITFSGGTGTTGNNRIDNFSLDTTPTPEPETWAMMALGLGALAMFTWKRKRSDGDVAYGSGFAL